MERYAFASRLASQPAITHSDLPYIFGCKCLQTDTKFVNQPKQYQASRSDGSKLFGLF